MAEKLEQLRLLPEGDLIEEVKGRREDQWFERASARITPRALADKMIGFANAEGGLIVVGIHGGELEGVGSEPSRINGWRQAAMDFTTPPVRHRFEEIECGGPEGSNRVLFVEVESGERVHQNVKGETLLRVGDENRRLGPLEAQELRYDKGDSAFDVSPASSDMRALDSTRVDAYVAALPGAARAEVALRARGLVVERDGEARPSVAGLLVLGENPQIEWPEASVRVLRYQGASRETGARSNVLDDVRFEGPIPSQIEGAQQYLRDRLPAAIRLLEQGRFEATPLIPEFAWLEAIVNAVTHRSYSLAGDHVRVEVFDDRLEVQSPGRLPGLVRIENIRSTRFARNPRVARAMSDLGYGRELGEGVNRMFEEMERVGLPDPIFTQGAAAVRVTLLADPLAGRVLRHLPKGSERFVEFLTREGDVTTTQAVDLLGASRPTVLAHLHRLVELGLLEHVGTSLKDPRGFWRLRRGEQ